MQPPLSGLVEKRETVEEGDAVLGERERVLRDAGVVETSGEDEGEREGDEGSREHGGLEGRGEERREGG